MADPAPEPSVAPPPGLTPTPAPPVIANIDEYKSETKQLIDLVASERALIKDISGVTLEAALLDADAAAAKTDVDNADTDFVVSSIRGAYEAYLRTIRDQIYPLALSSITQFETQFAKYGLLKIYFSADILEAAASNDKTRLQQSTLTSAETVALLNKYDDLTNQLSVQSAPTGTMFVAAKQQALDRISAYVQQIRRIEPLGGGGALLTTTGSVFQVSAQADFDTKKLNATTVIDIIELYNDTYVAKETTLLTAVRQYAQEILDGFADAYKVVTDPAAPLESYIIANVTDANTQLPTKRVTVTDSQSFSEIVGVVETYVGIVETLPLEIQRARAKRAITEVKNLMTQIQGLNTGIVFIAETPSIASVNKALTDVAKIRSAPILQQVADQYATILASVKTQFAAYALKNLTEFNTYWATVKQFSRIMPASVIDAASTVEADITAIPSQTTAEAATTSNKYLAALKTAKETVAGSEAAIKLLTKQNAVQDAITQFNSAVETAAVMNLTLDASGVATDSAAIFAPSPAPSISPSVLDSLQKKYVTLTTNAVSQIVKTLSATVTAFSTAVMTAQAKKATLPTNVRLAFTTLNADVLKLAGGKMTMLEMREMYQKYVQLTAAVTAALPATGDVTAAKTELQQMIQIFSSLISSPAATGIRFSDQVTRTNTVADTTAVGAATDIGALLAIRTRYVQMLYEVNTKIEEAKTAAATALTGKIQEATKAIADFETQLAQAKTQRFDLIAYPQVLDAETEAPANKALLAATDTITAASAETIRTTYADAAATLKYIIAAGSATDRASKYQAALLAMSRFTKIYQANMSVAQYFSATLRTAALQIPTDVTWIQDDARILTDYDTTRGKYDTLTSNILTELVTIKQDRVAATQAAIRQFQTAYNSIPSDQINALPPYLQMDARIISTDLDTVGSPGASLDIIAEISQKYTNYATALATAIPNLQQRQLATVAAKEAVIAVMRQLNTLFMENRAIYGTLSSGLQARIQQMGAKIRYLGGTDVGAAEVKGLLDDYTAALTEFRDVLFKKPPTRGTLDASLQAVITEFQNTYNAADIYALERADFNYIQLLLRNTANAYVTQNVPEAIRAFTRGIEMLRKVPRVTEQRVINAEYNALLEAVNYFLSEWAIRNLGRAIPNDRLFLTGLKTNAPALLATYKVRAPNIRNYDLIVKGLVDEYRQGLQVLRTYPMKS